MSLLNYVPCNLRVLCLTYSCASRASSSTCSSASRVLCALVPYHVPRAFHSLMPHVLCALHALAPHVRCTLCVPVHPVPRISCILYHMCPIAI